MTDLERTDFASGSAGHVNLPLTNRHMFGLKVFLHVKYLATVDVPSVRVS